MLPLENGLSLDCWHRIIRVGWIRLVATDGRIKAWYNDKLKMDWKVKQKKCYFKAGCYTQSNYKREKPKGSYGEVVIYRLELKPQRVDAGGAAHTVAIGNIPSLELFQVVPNGKSQLKYLGIM